MLAEILKLAYDTARSPENENLLSFCSLFILCRRKEDAIKTKISNALLYMYNFFFVFLKFFVKSQHRLIA
uniref:Uncharacterized protein n=1 Tax=Anaerobacillus isosaccharinicus TaxID=1532552 RepID=A0A1S2LIK1_9BACI